MRYIGPSHTWINSQPSNPITKKLDRLLVNSNFVASYPHAMSTFLPPLFSDHSPCILDLSFTLPSAGTQPYKFQNYLTKHPGSAELLKDAWIHAGNTCQTLSQLCWKLKLIKSDLKLLNKDNYSKIQERVSETNSLLQIAQVQALQDPNPTTFQAKRDLHQKWNFLREIEEMFFRQKSRVAVSAIRNFFATNFLPATTNATILSLVPKFPGATKISDFRPISCLNTIYKLYLDS